MMPVASTSPLFLALIRLKVDPGEEAAILARLPRDTAIKRLTMLIAALPGGTPAHLDPAMTAAQLMALLPRRPEASGCLVGAHSSANNRAVLYATLTSFMLGALCFAAYCQPLE
jgi:hypothetical protein